MSNPFSEEWLAQRNRDVLGIVVRDTQAVSAVVGSMLESEIEEECTKLLEEDGWRALRTDPVSDRSRGKGFGEPGMADHLYIRYHCEYGVHTMRKVGPDASWLAQSEIIWIEFKRPGEKAKKHQHDWHVKERARGALTLIAGEDFPATAAGFKDWYAVSGLKKLRA